VEVVAAVVAAAVRCVVGSAAGLAGAAVPRDIAVAALLAAAALRTLLRRCEGHRGGYGQGGHVHEAQSQLLMMVQTRGVGARWVLQNVVFRPCCTQARNVADLAEGCTHRREVAAAAAHILVHRVEPAGSTPAQGEDRVSMLLQAYLVRGGWRGPSLDRGDGGTESGCLGFRPGGPYACASRPSRRICRNPALHAHNTPAPSAAPSAPSAAAFAGPSRAGFDSAHRREQSDEAPTPAPRKRPRGDPSLLLSTRSGGSIIHPSSATSCVQPRCCYHRVYDQCTTQDSEPTIATNKEPRTLFLAI